MRQFTNILFFLMLFNTLNAQTIHFISVTDKTFPGVELDREKMRVEVETIANVCDMDVLIYEFEPKNEEAYKDKINNLVPDNDDIVWFYYSGNGMASDDETPYFGNNM